MFISLSRFVDLSLDFLTGIKPIPREPIGRAPLFFSNDVRDHFVPFFRELRGQWQRVVAENSGEESLWSQRDLALKLV